MQPARLVPVLMLIDGATAVRHSGSAATCWQAGTDSSLDDAR